MGHEIVNAVEDMDALLDGLMVLARSGHGLAGVESVDLAAAARAAAKRVRAGGVHVRLDLEPAGVRGERRLLERLAANLIENGVRYNAPGGFVSVSTRASADGARARRGQLRAAGGSRRGGAADRAVRAWRPHRHARCGARVVDRAQRGRGARGTACLVAACRGWALRARLAAGRVNGEHEPLPPRRRNSCVACELDPSRAGALACGWSPIVHAAVEFARHDASRAHAHARVARGVRALTSAARGRDASLDGVLALRSRGRASSRNTRSWPTEGSRRVSTKPCFS